MANRLRTLNDIRFDPFAASQGSSNIAAESQTVEAQGFGWYGIRLNEAPLQESPSSVSIPGYTEITSGEPTALQFIVDYTYKTGYIKFNAAANAAVVAVTYKGIGSPTEAAVINQHRTNATIDHPDSSVTTAKIAATAVTDAKLAQSAKDTVRQDNSELRLETRTSDPSSPASGRIWLRTDI